MAYLDYFRAALEDASPSLLTRLDSLHANFVFILADFTAN